MTTHEIANGLAHLADRLYKKPNQDVPDTTKSVVIPLYIPVYDEETKKGFLTFLKGIGEFRKEYNGGYFYAVVEMGAVQLLIWTSQSNLCRKVKVLKEVEEYECEPLFADEE